MQEERLEEAVMSNDQKAIKAAIKEIEKLQGPDAGSSPFENKPKDRKKDKAVIGMCARSFSRVCTRMCAFECVWT